MCIEKVVKRIKEIGRKRKKNDTLLLLYESRRFFPFFNKILLYMKLFLFVGCLFLKKTLNISVMQIVYYTVVSETVFSQA
jgi:hypothetical protein